MLGDSPPATLLRAMSALFAKLNLKDQQQLVIANAPPEFGPHLTSLKGRAVALSLAQVKTADFLLGFATTQAQVDGLAKQLKKVPGDAVVWLAYPKGSSKKYRCEFNRDTGWKALGAAGFEPVRQVAIDEDWSALRFRREEFIKTLTRSPAMALTRAGKARTTPKRAPRR